MGITVLLPGGFKPPHEKHYRLAKRFSELDSRLKELTIDQVLVMMGPTDRDGITREDSIDVWEILAKNDPKIIPTPVDSNNPLQSAFDYPRLQGSGDFILAAGIKDDDQRRVRDFVEAYSEGGKYYSPDINIVTIPQKELEYATEEMIYSGRNDSFEGKPFSATALRQDILNNDEESFKTNYPNIPEDQVSAIWGILQGKVVPKAKKRNQ